MTVLPPVFLIFCLRRRFFKRAEAVGSKIFPPCLRCKSRNAQNGEKKVILTVFDNIAPLPLNLFTAFPVIFGRFPEQPFFRAASYVRLPRSLSLSPERSEDLSRKISFAILHFIPLPPADFCLRRIKSGSFLQFCKRRREKRRFSQGPLSASFA